MRWSQTLIPTQKQDPADATLASHKLLVRGGFVRQLQAGSYTFLPLGWRVMRKIMAIVREEMEAAGAVEVHMPALQPIDLWRESGRDAKFGDDMLRATDRRGATNALAPTHEEAVTEFVRAYVKSYRQLPLNVFQIQTKFRDEPRPRSGLLRVREFLMKDAYSLDKDQAGLDASFTAMFEAYRRIYARCGIPAIAVDADPGAIGGSESVEFTVPCDAGEDIILSSDKGNYAANVEKAATGERAWSLEGEPTGELRVVDTPATTTISDLCAMWKEFAGGKLKPQNTLKSVLFKATASEPGGVGQSEFNAIGIVRGDHNINEAKLIAALSIGSDWFHSVTPMDAAEATARGFVPGYVGPAVLETLTQEEYGRTYLFVDPDAATTQFWVAGANAQDRHVMHFNWRRDAPRLEEHARHEPKDRRVLVADIRDAVAGDPSPLNDGGVLRESRGVEVGHVFKLGTVYSEKMGATFLDENNREKPVIMGCYGIGVGRIALSAVEVGHDERGIIWPAGISPYEVVITPIKYDGVMREKADALYDRLKEADVDVLLDDRDERPGGKFADADLIGVPVRVTVGDRGLARGVVEVKERGETEAQEIEYERCVEAVTELLAKLKAPRHSAR